MTKAISIILLLVPAACGQPAENHNTAKSDTVKDTATQLLKDTLTKKAVVTEPPFVITSCALQLSDKIQEILTNYNPRFKAWTFGDYAQSCVGAQFYQCTEKQTPFAVIGDFNGDTIPDLTLMGHTAANDVTLSLLSDKTEFRVIEISKTDLSDPTRELVGGYGKGLWVYLSHRNPGKIKSHYESKELILRNDAFEVIYCGKAATIHYFKKDRFVTYASAD